MDKKRCPHCNTYKLLQDFTKTKWTTDGLNCWCRDCTKANSKKGYEAHKKERKLQTSNYSKTEKGKEVNKKSVSKWIQKNPKKYVAHISLKLGIIHGFVQVKNCCICDSSQSQAHHEDYDRPYDVVWYCSQHHHDRHKELKGFNQLLEERK